MVVSVKFVGSFRGISGKEKLALNFGRPVSLMALVEKIVEQVPKLRSSLIDPESGESRRSMLVLVNGKEISVLNGLETCVNDEDEVVFVPVVHGG
ncbi:MAG TPA: MoaD/ThiS family protein [Candidatus Acidoferrales bacterium]|nr:MoaD/ThiS family protein [Candidatus Acidoferrales bacterium]